MGIFSLSDSPTLGDLAVGCGAAVPAWLDSAVGVAAVVVSQRESVVALFISVDHSVPAVARAALLLFGAEASVAGLTVVSAVPSTLHLANTTNLRQ